MRRSLYIIIGVALLSFAACGRQQKAKSVVKDFVEQSLHKDVTYLDFSDVDSTHTISDSLIQVLRHRGPQGIKYQKRRGVTLLYLRTYYLDGQDSCSTTFYLDYELSGVVAYKDNK